MGVGKIILIVFLTIVFIPFLILGNLFMTISLSYSFDSISEGAEKLISSQIPEDASSEGANSLINSLCSSKDQVNFQGLTIDCTKVSKETAMKDVLKQIYERDYECSFIDCYRADNKMIFISEKTDSNLSKIAWTFSGIMLVFFLIYFLTFRKKSNFMLFSGIILLLFSSTTHLAKSVASQQISGLERAPLSSMGLSPDKILNIFLGQSNIILILWATLGIMLIAGGIIAKILSEGDKQESPEGPSQEQKTAQRKPTRKQAKSQEPINPKIVKTLSNYIKKGRSKGHSSEELRNMIRNKGYSNKEFEEAMRRYRQGF